MATITFDGATKVVTVGYDGPVTNVSAADLYSGWKAWVLAGNAQWVPAFGLSVGGNELGGGVSLAGYYFLRNDLGWTLEHEPYDYQIIVAGDLYPSDPTIPFLELGTDMYTVTWIFQRSAASMVIEGAGADPAGIADAVWDRATSGYGTPASMGGVLAMLGVLARNKTVTDPAAGTYTVYDVDGITPLYSASLWQDVAGTVPYAGAGADRRDRLV